MWRSGGIAVSILEHNRADITVVGREAWEWSHKFCRFLGALGYVVGGAVASWLVCSTPKRMVRVRVLAKNIVLSSWARHFTSRCLSPPRCINGINGYR